MIEIKKIGLEVFEVEKGFTLGSDSTPCIANTVGLKLVNAGWEVTSDLKNLCYFFLPENAASQSGTDFYHEAKKLKI